MQKFYEERIALKTPVKPQEKKLCVRKKTPQATFNLLICAKCTDKCIIREAWCAEEHSSKPQIQNPKVYEDAKYVSYENTSVND